MGDPILSEGPGKGLMEHSLMNVGLRTPMGTREGVNGRRGRITALVVFVSRGSVGNGSLVWRIKPPELRRGPAYPADQVPGAWPTPFRPAPEWRMTLH